MKKIEFTVTFLVIFVLLLAIVLLIFPKYRVVQQNDNTNMYGKASALDSYGDFKQVAVSPDGNYTATLNSLGYSIIDLNKRESRSFPNSTHSKVFFLLWSTDSKRLYTAGLVDTPPIYSDYSYVDMSGAHKYVTTGIVPDVNTVTADIFAGKADLVGSKGDSLYIVSQGSLYELPIYGTGDSGGVPRLLSQDISQYSINTTIVPDVSWKVYNNASFGLSIKMPTNWHVRTVKDEVISSGVTDVSYPTGLVSLESSTKPLFRSSGKAAEDESKVSQQGVAVQLTKEPFTSKSLAEYLDSNYGTGEWNSSEVTIGHGITASQVEYTGGVMDYSEEYYFTKNGFLYHVGVVSVDEVPGATVTEMLASLELIK